MKTNFSLLMLILVNIILSVLGQFVTKLGIQKVGSFSSMPILSFIAKSFLSPLVLLGLFIYLISAMIWFMVLSKAELSVAYPALSLGYILILFVGYFFLGEQITLAKGMGVGLICLGIYSIFR